MMPLVDSSTIEIVRSHKEARINFPEISSALKRPKLLKNLLNWIYFFLVFRFKVGYSLNTLQFSVDSNHNLGNIVLDYIIKTKVIATWFLKFLNVKIFLIEIIYKNWTVISWH